MTEREGQDQLGADTAGEDKKITPLPMDSSDSSDAESEGETYDICLITAHNQPLPSKKKKITINHFPKTENNLNFFALNALNKTTNCTIIICFEIVH